MEPMRTKYLSLAVLVAMGLAWGLLGAARPASACTSILVTPGASVDGATMITYAADSMTMYGDLSYLPAMDHPPGTMRPIYEWDTGDLLGEIPEVAHTYAVVGLMNEHQVVIGETTFGGRPELVDPTGGIDYGTLMFLALQRAETAREAIGVMTSLVAEHGYRSAGESISVGDPREAWILEIVGKGPGSKGAVWVARRVPDGKISAHANQSRIGRFPLRDKKSCLYAPDVISFAREKGWFSGADEEFSFADAYEPMTFKGRRICEARVWSVFRRAAPSLGLSIDYGMGVPEAEPLPLWIEPDRKLSVGDVMALMRDHYEGTELDMTTGLAAGPFGLPYRWRPLFWMLDGVEYFNERPISTQQTGFSFVSQSRAGLPDPIGGVLWFGVDDTYSTVYVPMYCGIREVPAAFAEGTGSFTDFSWDAAFWVFNFVSNFAYLRYEAMIGDIRKVQRELEGGFLGVQADVERAAVELHRRAPELARDYLTTYSRTQAEQTLRRWRTLGEELLVRHLDGNRKVEHGRVTFPGYPEAFRRQLVAETGDFLRVKPLPDEPADVQTVVPAGYFHGRAELGARAADVPETFPFEREKLFLHPGTDACGRPPRCCLELEADTAGEHLLLEVPEEPPDDCGARAWLVRVGRDEQRPIVTHAAGH